MPDRQRALLREESPCEKEPFDGHRRSSADRGASNAELREAEATENKRSAKPNIDDVSKHRDVERRARIAGSLERRRSDRFDESERHDGQDDMKVSARLVENGGIGLGEEQTKERA